MSEESKKTAEQDENVARQMVQEIIERNATCHKSDDDAQMIRKAFELANDAHRGMRRRSGELYIFHPVAVARIVAEEIGLDATSVAAALLHDVVEDTELTLPDIEQMFSPSVAHIVDGLTKLDVVIDQHESLQAENFRKLLVSMIEDVRIILIKLADRLHNMRTLESLPDHKRYRIAAETLYIYAPIANRLGLYAIKTELEDLSLKYEQPKAYQDIYDRLQTFKRDFQVVIDSVMVPLRKRLDERGYKYEIKARTKSIYSIWRKMQNKGVQFEEIYDIIASRVVFEPKEGMEEKTQCWDIYSILTDLFRPNPDRLRDWVSTPKSNGYEALHTTVMSPEGRWVEVQIRSKRMDEVAERGLAAHWKYKGEKGDSEIDAWLEGLKKMLDNASQNSMEFMDAFKLNLFSQELMIFTPHGDTRMMPAGSTALDFAFALHSNLGFHCIGAKVNYKLEPLSYVLKSGDQVEIITSDKQKPKYEWINFCTTAKAKTCIREAFREYRHQTIEKGEQKVAEELSKVKLSVNARIIQKMLSHYHFENKDDLYYSIGAGTTNVDGLEKALRQNSTSKWIKFWHLTFGDKKKTSLPQEEDEDHDLVMPKGKNIILSDDDGQQKYNIATCCRPIPGDDIVAYIEDDGSMTLHSRTCPEALKLMSSQGNRIVSAQWESHKVLSYLVEIEVNGIDRQGVVAEITGLIASELHVKMRSVSFEGHDGIFVGSILLYTYSAADLNTLIEALKKVKGVHSVSRKETKTDNK
ncbi:MAG: RelA/SpoT family protein [Marinilabiliaceae bacterium]